jgi:hypothetical protein
MVCVVVLAILGSEQKSEGTPIQTASARLVGKAMAIVWMASAEHWPDRDQKKSFVVLPSSSSLQA